MTPETPATPAQPQGKEPDEPQTFAGAESSNDVGAVPRDPHARLDGLRAWLAQVDRRLGIRSYALGAVAVVALAVGIAGLVLALDAQQDKATQVELEATRDRLAQLEETSLAASRHNEDISSVAERLDRVSNRLSRLSSTQGGLSGQLASLQSEIDSLESQLSQLQSSSPSGP